MSYFPTNYRKWLNGTTVPDDIMFDYPLLQNCTVGMLGVMDEDEYNSELKKEHGGRPTPIDFPGYNSPDFELVFWSSDELTYSSVILTLTQCQYLFK